MTSVRNVMGAVCVAVFLALLAVPGLRSQEKIDVKKLLEQSDKHFAEAGKGTALDARAWRDERERLEQVEAALRKEPDSVVKVKVYRRLGVALIFLSKGKGDEAADGWYTKAMTTLQALADKEPKLPQVNEHTATILKEKADNLVLLGKNDRALSELEKALKAARNSSYKDQLGEATIRERLAGIYFRGEKWKDALDTIKPGVAILDNVANNKPDFNREAFRAPLWYLAVTKSRLKEDAQPDFDRFLKEFKDKLTAHDLADALREKAVNIGECAPKEEGAERTAALKKALAVIKEAKAAIDESKDKRDALEKYVILSDLGMAHWRLAQRAEAEANFKVALEVARKAHGRDWPGLIPVLNRYADLLKVLDRKDDEAAIRKEIRRIGALRK